MRALFSDISRPNIFLLWHNRILMGPLIYFVSKRTRKIYTIISASRDGALATAVMNRLGMGVVRGSSSKRASQAMRELLHALDNNADIVITPDGPRGPLYRMGPGVSLLLRHSNARVVLLSCNPRHAKRLKSWDGFYIPYPFTTIELDAEIVEDNLRTLQDSDYSFRDALQKRFISLTKDTVAHPLSAQKSR